VNQRTALGISPQDSVPNTLMQPALENYHMKGYQAGTSHRANDFTFCRNPS